jgi:hypothetical protein
MRYRKEYFEKLTVFETCGLALQRKLGETRAWLSIGDACSHYMFMEDWIVGKGKRGNELLVCQQRCPFAVLADNVAPRERITAQEAWHTHGQRQDKEDGTNREGEYPLKLENGKLGEELTDTSGCAHISLVRTIGAKARLTESENRQGKAHGVILVCSQEEHAVGQDSPNEDIGDDPAH